MLITGGSGFIGSRSVEHYQDFAEEIRVLDNLRTGYRHNLDGLRHTFIEGSFKSPPPPRKFSMPPSAPLMSGIPAPQPRGRPGGDSGILQRPLSPGCVLGFNPAAITPVHFHAPAYQYARHLVKIVLAIGISAGMMGT
jgi:hypothetical protein